MRVFAEKEVMPFPLDRENLPSRNLFKGFTTVEPGYFKPDPAVNRRMDCLYHKKKSV